MNNKITMDEPDEQKSIKEKIIERIEKERRKIKPKYYFIVKTLLVVAGIIAAFILSIFIGSFLIFILKITGLWFLPGFGMRGIGFFLGSFPWLLLFAAAAFIVIIDILLGQYSLSYRRPLIYSLLGIILLVVAGGFITAQTPIHQKFFRYAEEDRLPFMGDFYRGYGMMNLRNAYLGTVGGPTSDGFELHTKNGEIFRVVFSPNTHFPEGKEIPDGEEVLVMGEKQEEIIRAFGVRPIADKEFYRDFRRPRAPMMPMTQPRFFQ